MNFIASKYKKIIIAETAVLVLALLVLFLIIGRQFSIKHAKTEQGINYLKELESQDVSAISKEIKSIETELNLNAAEDNENAIWGQFDNAAILGDSRAVGFYFHEFLPESQVLAEGGGKITDVENYIEPLKALKPDQIFLCFGLNDIGIGFWPEPSDYVTVCKEEIELLNKELPDSTVYLNSILPATGVGLEADPNYPRIGDYNEALKAAAEEYGWHFIDNTEMAMAHQDLYNVDGLHVLKEFYKYWAANMLTEVE